MSENLLGSVTDALRTVIDPELGYNIVDIGLVYDIAVEGESARVVLTTTTPGCPATNYIRQAAHDSVAMVPGLAAVEVAMTWDPLWSPARMSAAAKQHFGVPA